MSAQLWTQDGCAPFVTRVGNHHGAISVFTISDEQRYTIDKSAWAALLDLAPEQLPSHREWPQLLAVLRTILRWSRQPELTETSEYLRTSATRQLLERIRPELAFAASKPTCAPPPPRLRPPSSRPCRTSSPTYARSSASSLVTLCYIAYVSVNVSVRLDDDLAERLRLRARAAGETLSDRLRRYAEEGARREEHPLITFRDGPTGRRAGLLGGPDVWEVAMWVEDLAAEPDPVAALVEESTLSRSHVDAALRYRTAYPDEIATRIELHRRETAAADAH